MKKLFVLIAVLICSQCCFAQYFPDTAWTRCYGGTLGDEGVYIQQTFDGGYIVLGKSNSMDGDLVNPPAGTKRWILKLDSLGNIEWQTYMNGTGVTPFNIRQTTDSGYIVGGGKFTKLDASGNITWQIDTPATCVVQTYDGGYALAYSRGVRKLSSTAMEEWYSEVGVYSNIVSLEQTSDSGFVSGFYDPGDQSPDAHALNKKDKNGASLYWLSITTTGPSYPLTVKPCMNGNVIAVGEGTLFSDPWGYISLCDSTQLWHKEMFDRFPYDVVEREDSSFVLCGTDTMDNAFISKHTPDGDEMLSLYFGGSNDDVFTTIIKTRDSGYIAIGTTRSIDGDVWGNHGDKDMWIVKFKKDTSVYTPPVLSLRQQVSKIDEVKVYPTLSNGIVNVSLPRGYEGADINVFDIVGRAVEIKNAGTGNKRCINLSQQPVGQYILEVRMNSERRSFRVSLNP